MAKAKAPSKSKAQLEGEIRAAVAVAARGPVSHAQRLMDEEVRVIDDLARETTDPMRRTRARMVQHELLLAGEADAYEEGEGAGHRRKAWAMARPLFARR